MNDPEIEGTGALYIEGVDLELLERQRLALVRITDALESCSRPEPEDMELVAGLQIMLDNWSDKIYHAQIKTEQCYDT